METLKDKQKVLPLHRALKLKEMYDRKYNRNNNNDDDVDDDMYLYGFAKNPFQPEITQYVSIGTISGLLNIVLSYTIGIDSPGQAGNIQKFLVDEVVSVDNSKNTSFILVNDKGDREQVAQVLYTIGTTDGSVTRMSNIFSFKGGAINALSWFASGVAATFRIQPADTAGRSNNIYTDIHVLII